MSCCLCIDKVSSHVCTQMLFQRMCCVASYQSIYLSIELSMAPLVVYTRSRCHVHSHILLVTIWPFVYCPLWCDKLCHCKDGYVDGFKPDIRAAEEF